MVSGLKPTTLSLAIGKFSKLITFMEDQKVLQNYHQVLINHNLRFNPKESKKIITLPNSALHLARKMILT
jgi:hypothetical protein